MQQRYYEPVAGRFLSVDPVTTSQSSGTFFNRYKYAENNPYRYVDPDGRCPSASRIGAAPGSICGGSAGGLPTATVAAYQKHLAVAMDKGATAVAGTVVAIVSKHPAIAATKWLLGANSADPNSYAKPPADAYDPNGPKAPGKPGRDEGFKDPKGGDDWVKNPNGRGYGWRDKGGDVWVPTGPYDPSKGDSHGGSHWDVQTPGGGYVNVYPGGARRP